MQNNAKSPKVMASSLSFNRHPLSDTPVQSISNSPSQLPLSGYSITSAGHTSASGSEATTPTSGPLRTGPSNNNNNNNNIKNIGNDGPTSDLTGKSHKIPPLHLPPRRVATTLDVPGLTRSKASPDGLIAARDVESKLVIVMVGLPARGKSYVTKKLCRYLNWQQHSARIFNVGNTRRKANQNVGPSKQPLPDTVAMKTNVFNHNKVQTVTSTISNDADPSLSPTQKPLDAADNDNASNPTNGNNKNPTVEHKTSQSADFFSPDNPETFALREKWAMDTLEELLDYVLDGNGSVGILDATNSTIARRRKVLNRINERSNGRLKVLFLESICSNNAIIESNIRLKLSGPDYKDVDTDVAINDFVARMRNYEKAYETIGAEEEADDNFQYIKMIDVGRKVVCYNIKGFLAGQAVFFLLNFNLNERQIWITRHGESEDNAAGRIGGDAPLTARGRKFAAAAARFMRYQKKEFRKQQLKNHQERVRILSRSEPTTPMNEPEELSFCVWTSMLRRSIETGDAFSEEDFDIKEMRMLNELGAGICDGMTYPEIKEKFPQEYAARMADKIQYRYPGPGGESYLDVINRLRPVIVEIERMTDNALIIGHRVVCRVLLAYFLNLGREAIGDLDVPLHTLYCLEPKPYGVAWEVYEYNDETDWFYKISKEVLKEKSLRSRAAKAERERQFSVLPTGRPGGSGSVVYNSSLGGGGVLPTVSELSDALGSVATGSRRYQPNR